MIGQFVRVRHTHPLGGMTGTVVAVDGRTVTVRLTAWGSCQTFDRLALREDVPIQPETRADRIAHFRQRLRVAVERRAS